MSNPYKPPIGQHQDRGVQALVQWPAIALIVVSIFAIGCGVLALAGDVALIATGALERLEEQNRGPISKYTQITVRTIWGVVLVIASSYVLYGAIQMKNLKNYGTARAAAMVAMIPLLGPCCILGIPFGIWAFVTLGKPEVQSEFR